MTNVKAALAYAVLLLAATLGIWDRAPLLGDGTEAAPSAFCIGSVVLMAGRGCEDARGTGPGARPRGFQ